MYTSIIVPLDGTPFSMQALPLALGLALRSNAAVHLVHVREPAVQGDGAPIAAKRRSNESYRENQPELAALAADLRRLTSLSIEVVTVDGDTAAALGQHTHAHRSDLIVMMSHGRASWSRAFMRSIAEELVRHTSVPLLLVHPRGKWPATLDEPLFRHVLVPLDGSAWADDALDRAVCLATPDQTTFTLLTVINTVSPRAYPNLSDRTVGDATFADKALVATEARLKARATELRESGLQVQTLVLRHQQPAQAILRAADDHGVDSIALSTHGLDAIVPPVLGSVAAQLIREAKVPILIYRPELVAERQPGGSHVVVARPSDLPAVR